MTDTDRPPEPIDVFEHAMMSLDEEHYQGNILLARQGDDGAALPDRDLVEEAAAHPERMMRCFAGQSIVHRAQDFSQALDKEDDERIDYRTIAQVYQVPYQLVLRIGQGVIGLDFAEATDFVLEQLLACRQDPEDFADRRRSRWI